MIRILGSFALLFTTACSTTLMDSPAPPEEPLKLVFEDSMASDWQENWFLDGEKATMEHRDGGLEFLTEYTVNKNVDREGFDAQHAVLWTRQEFEGDIRISYTYTVLPGSSWQKLIYIQAQGIGEKEFAEDIYTWRDHRKIAVMSDYFNYMDLIGISLRNPMRCRRYPTNNILTGESLDNEIMPRTDEVVLPQGVPLNLTIDKRATSVHLVIQNTETGEDLVNHTWDLTQNAHLYEPKYVTKGRLGLRLMGGYKIFVKNLKIEQLPPQ